MIRLISILKSHLKGVCLLDKIDEFEGLVAECERETGKKLEDDVKIGVVVMVMDAGPLRRHLLLHIEKCDRYDTLETLAQCASGSFCL